MGGATLGYSLARGGRRVLFVERGLDLRSRDSDRLRDRFVEDHPDFRRLSGADQQRESALGGRSTDDIEDRSHGRVATFSPYIGCGTGGSTALYGMVLERLFPVDFVRGTAHPDDPRSSLLAAWPIDYEDLRPWYEAAETLYRVRGGADPLRPGEATRLLPVPGLSPAGAAIVETLTAQGVHPYR